jgi:hypothetical protein
VGRLQGAFQGRQLDVKNSTQQMQQLAIYQAGKARGLSDAEAVTAALDPAGAGKLLFDRKVVPELKPVQVGDQTNVPFNSGSGQFMARPSLCPKAEKVGPAKASSMLPPPVTWRLLAAASSGAPARPAGQRQSSANGRRLRASYPGHVA